MTDVAVLALAQQALYIAALITAPMLMLSLIVGLTVSVFQAATQIQDMTVSFVPKLVAMVIALLLTGPWILRVLIAFTTNVLVDLPRYAK